MISPYLWRVLVLAAILQYVHRSEANSEESTNSDQEPSSGSTGQPSVQPEDTLPLFLTPYIERCDYDTAKIKSKVQFFQYMANVSAYSGLITVNKTYNSSLFFLFLLAEGNSSTAPILLWTQGGPGLSSLFGQFLENGPIAFDGKPNVSIRTNTLQKNMSIIYLDVPIGSGFSFTEKVPEGYSTSLEDITRDVMEFLKQFFELFYEYQNRDFYLAGESYGARYSMAIANQLLSDKKNLPLNLKGTIGGNGFLGPVLQTADSSEFLYQTSMLDEKGRAAFAFRFEMMRQMAQTENATMVPYILLTTIFADPTGAKRSVFQNLTFYNDHASPLYTQRPLHMLMCFVFLNQSVYLRRQIHVGDNATFRYGDQVLLTRLAADWLRDISEMTQRVLNESRVLLYTGQIDALFPSVKQRDYLATLNWTRAEEYRKAPRSLWRPPFWNDYMGYAGFIKKVPSFTEAVLLGMSHYGAADKPAETYYLITEFIANSHQEEKVDSPAYLPDAGTAVSSQ